MIRSLFRFWFPKLLNVLFILSILFVVIGAFSLSSNPYNGRFMPMVFLPSLVGGIAATMCIFGVVYILLDIRDAVEKHSKNN